MIIDAVIPLLLEHGRGVTSRQIADAAGIAEGTIFRAFGDKETLVQAAIEKYLDPEPLREALRSIDPALPLENKVRAILYLLRERFQSVMRIMAGDRPASAHPSRRSGASSRAIIARILEPEARRAQLAARARRPRAPADQLLVGVPRAQRGHRVQHRRSGPDGAGRRRRHVAAISPSIRSVDHARDLSTRLPTTEASCS